MSAVRWRMIVARSRPGIAIGTILGLLILAGQSTAISEEPRVDFARQIAPLLEAHCVRCHHAGDAKGGLSLESAMDFQRGGDQGPLYDATSPENSLLLSMITVPAGSSDKPAMPKDGDPLGDDAVALFKRWLSEGAVWPPEVRISTDRAIWWSLRPIRPVAVPQSPDGSTAIDGFINQRLQAEGIEPLPQADRATLVRRIYFDLTGLPPTYEQVESFVHDPHPLAYQRLVDRLLASPEYGERWARYWLDLVHFGETHGYDKDKPRPNAWPYRDYVIRSLNADKPYGQFVAEQIAGDVIAPDTADGIQALGFIAAGPWDFIGHAEVPETKVDGKIARHLDRDDMIAATINTFCSMTVHCAQCHDHKFDPITQEDYYSLQAVFAALDRTDRPYDTDPMVAARRREWKQRVETIQTELKALEMDFQAAGGERLAAIDQRMREASKSPAPPPAEHGYHSAIVNRADIAKWVQLDLGDAAPQVNRLVLVACHDDFNQIGAGFGFPVRYRIETCDASEFTSGVSLVHDKTDTDQRNPGVVPITIEVEQSLKRFVRVTATQLALRQNDYIFALAELQALDAAGQNQAQGRPVTALDSIEAPNRWRAANLVDGIYPQPPVDLEVVTSLRRERDALLAAVVPENKLARHRDATKELAEVKKAIEGLPAPKLAYVGTVHNGSGPFAGTGGQNGKPRPIHLLARGDVTKPGVEVGPGALRCIESLPSRFQLSDDAPESSRRQALADWLTDPEHPLVWRSIVNRLWQHHFGHGIVDTPNDFGRMGQTPSHPELLDHLVMELRGHAGSLKQIHRQIVTSDAYQRASVPTGVSTQLAMERDRDNRWLWRQQRRRLDSEATRDAMLFAAGMLNRQMGGPSFQDFVIDKPEHSPHYEYHLYNAEDVRTHRRSVYRFVVRSQLQPWMAALDCADPSMLVDKRNETISPAQALAMLNDQLTMVAAKRFATRLEGIEGDLPAKIQRAAKDALSRELREDERQWLIDYASTFGLENTCRLLLNLNEFVFVD